MGAHHDHDHSHRHAHSGRQNRPRLALAALLTGAFMIIELIGGVISGSLALIADAGHMLTDFAALSMAWAASLIALRPADKNYTFGYDRVAILVAFVNGLTLFLVAGWILWEAVHRLGSPREVMAETMIWIAGAGLLVNVIVFKVLSGANQDNLNIRGAVLHVIGDMLGSIAAIAAALVIMATGWVSIDPILSCLVAFLILRSAWYLVKDSSRVLLDGTPKGLSAKTLEADIIEHVEGLANIEVIHLWSVSDTRQMVILKAFVKKGASQSAARYDIESYVKSHWHIQDIFIDVSAA